MLVVRMARGWKWLLVGIGLLLASCGGSPAASSVTPSVAAVATLLPIVAASPTTRPSVAPPTGTPSAPTLAPTSVPPAPTTAPQPTALPALPSAEQISADAVQTLIDYYRNINARNYQAAYSLWSGNGQASQQSFSQFQQGYSETRQVDIVLANPTNQGVGAGHVTVDLPITIIAATDNAIQQFSGMYSLQASNGTGGPYQGWKIVSANISPSNAPINATTPLQTLQSYYEAINQRQFPSAYTLWSEIGAASGQSYAEFERGFATTTSVQLTPGQVTQDAGAGSVHAELPVTIVAKQSDGSTQTFCGTYQFLKPNVVGAGNMPWRIDRASISAQANCPTP